jgi:NTE family protein
MYGLVLEGGGSKGSYQIGACRALAEMGIEYKAVAGTSVGALNGAMVVQGDIDRAYALWHDINPYNVIKMTDEELEGFSESSSRVDSLNIFMKKLRKVVAERGLDTAPLVELLESAIDERKIRNSEMDFGIVTVDLTSRKALEIYKEDIPEGRLVDYILASASFPAFRRAVIDGRVFIDGGFYNALPINLVKNKSCSDIIVLRTNSLGVKKRVDRSGLNITTIEPSEGLGPILDFNSGRTRQNLKLGYFDAMKVFKKLKGSRYYILPDNDDSFFINYLAGMDENKIRRLCGLFGVEGRSRRVLFEYLVPRIADLLSLPPSAAYEDVFIGLLERIAQANGIERFRIYSAYELYLEIAGCFCKANDDFLGEIPGFLKNRDLLTRFVKDRIISSIADIIFRTDVKG